MGLRLRSKSFWIGVLALIVAAGSVGIALASKPAQSGYDLYVVVGDHCNSALSYTDNLAAVIPGKEAFIYGTYDFGELIEIHGAASAPGNEAVTASLEYLVCLKDRTRNFYTDFTVSSVASGGYIVGYEYDVRRDSGTSPLYHEEDTIGGGSAACLDMAEGISGTVAAVSSGSYYYGMKFYADGSVNSRYCEADGVAEADIVLIVSESESPTPTPTLTGTPAFFSPLSTPPFPTPTPVVCGAGYRLSGAECVADHFLEDAAQESHIKRLGVQAVPTCNGAELLSSPVWLSPGQSWSKLQRVPYGFFNVRFTVFVNGGEQYATTLYAGSHNDTAHFGDGILGGYYAAMVPAPPLSNPGGGDNLIQIEHMAGSSGNMQVASICIEEALLEECANPDPYLEDPLFWTANGPVTFDDYGGAILDPGGYVYQYYNHMDAGNYRLSIDAAAVYPETVMEVNYHYSNTLTARIGLPGSPSGVWAWNRYIWEFAVEEGTEDYARPIGAGSISENDDPERDKLIYIYRICIQTLPDDPTPTPTPTITPQPTPGASACYNPDTGFDLSGLWTLNNAVIEDSELSLMLANASASIDVNIPAGTYGVSIMQRSLPGVCDGGQKRTRVSYWGESYMAASFFIDAGTGSYNTYYVNRAFGRDITRIQLEAECYTPGMSPQAVPIEAAFMQVAYLCVGGVVAPGTATPTPRPTATNPPGMTATPTPACQGPSDCLNADPGMCGGGTWATVGGASIAGGEALLPPGSRIVAEIDQDPAKSYYVHITMKCNWTADSYIDWRNLNVETTCGSSGFAEYTYLFPATGATGVLAQPLTELLDDTWQPGILISPLQGPVAPASDGAHPWNMLLAGDVFNFGVADSSVSWVTVDSICIQDSSWLPIVPTPGPGAGFDPTQLEIWHPVCERDYAIQRSFSDSILSKQYAMLIGPGDDPGMPVHAIGPGVVTAYGENVSYLLGDNAATETYAGCVVVDHTATFGAAVFSYYCNLDRFTIPSSLIVARGQLLGYTSDYQGDNGLRGDGLLAFAIRLTGAWDNPAAYFDGYADCRPYNIVPETYETCAAEEGSNLIPPRFNPETPSFWDVSEYIPWLAKTAYDVIGYPILCALVPLINLIITTLIDFANAVIRAISPPLIFLYRIGRVFEYLLYVWRRVIDEIVVVLDALEYTALCFRTIIVYFVGAIRAAASARVNIAVPSEGSPFAFAIALAMTLISSTVANIFLTPIVSLFIAFAAWKLIPWGIQNLRKAIGAQ